MSTAEDLIQEIEKLSPVERIRVIDRVIRDTIKPDPDIEKVWIREAVARWDSFQCGETETVPYDAVMAKYRDKR